MRTLAVSVAVVLALALVPADAKKPFKGFGKGNPRSSGQHVINTLHPTGQSRAAAEHALNTAVPNGPTALPNGPKPLPPGQARCSAAVVGPGTRQASSSSARRYTSRLKVTICVSGAQ